MPGFEPESLRSPIQHANCLGPSDDFKRLWINKNADFDKLKTDITNVNWDCKSGSNMIYQSYSVFSEQLLELTKQHMLTKLLTVRRNDLPWFYSKIGIAIKN